MKEIRNNKGITLIALVITVIVMVLLVGITISILTSDNSLINRTLSSLNTNDAQTAREIVMLAANAVKVESKTNPMTKSGVARALKDEIVKASGDDANTISSDLGTSLETGLDVYMVVFRKYRFEVADDFTYAKLVEEFNAEKWDKGGVTPETAFVWGSENPNDGELYHTIIGYQESLMSYPVVRIPSRCTAIDLQYTSENNSGRIMEYPDVNRQISRIFDQFFAPGENQLGGITKIEIPETVTKLSGAFMGFTSLEEVVLPYTLTEISGASFYGCSNLRKITIPSRVTKIGGYCFYYCSELEEINLSDDIQSIGNYAFYGTKWYDNLSDGEIYIGKVFYKYKGTMPETYTVKDGTKCVAPMAFTNMVKQPWGSYDIQDNDVLRKVNFPNSVEEIGVRAFTSCKNLTNVVLPATIKIIDEYAFCNCPNIDEIVLPSGIKKIGKEAFSSTGIQSVTANGNIEKMDGYTFNYTPWYDNQPNGLIYINNVLYKYKNNGYYNENQDYTISVKDGTTCIANGAFSGCSDVYHVQLPNSVTIIGDGAFSSCNNLTTIEMSNNIQEIGESAFSYDGNLELDMLPTSLKIIRQYSFQNCSKSFTTFNTIPNGVKYIGRYAFYGTGLEKVTIPASVKMIAHNAFSYCSKLQEVTISEGLQILTDAAFANCEGLKNVQLPKSIMFYGADVFSEDINIVAIRVNKKRENTVLEKRLEDGCPEGTLIFYLGEGQETYNITTAEENITVISKAYQNQRVTVSSKTEDKVVTQFDVNGETVNGTYFSMPAKDVVISNVVFGEQLVIEQVFNDQMLYNETFETAFEEDTSIRLDFDYDTTKSGTWIDVWLYDSNGIFIKRFSNTELHRKPVYVNDKGVKIVLRNWQELSNYKFKCRITKTDEIGYRATETPHPYKGNAFYTFTTKYDTAESVRVTFDEQSKLNTGDSICFYDRIYNNEDDYWDTQKDYVDNNEITTKEIIQVPGNEVSMVLYSNSKTNEEYGFKYNIEKYETPEDVLESSHQYENGLYDGKVYTKRIEGADNLMLIFDEKTYFEWNCDRINIYYTDQYGNDIWVGEYTGDQLSGQTIGVPADNVKIILYTDGSVIYYGFRCQIKKATIQQVGTPVIVESPHNYENDQDYNFYANIEDDIDFVTIEFDSQSAMEPYADYIEIYNNDTGAWMAYKTGYLSANDTLTFQNVRNLRFYMHTDSSVINYGFKCTIQGYKLMQVEE